MSFLVLTFLFPSYFDYMAHTAMTRYPDSLVLMSPLFYALLKVV